MTTADKGEEGKEIRMDQEKKKSKGQRYYDVVDAMTQEERNKYYFHMFMQGTDTWEECSDILLYEKDKEKHLARITFNNPDYQNAIPHEAYPRLRHLIKQAEYDDDVKVLIFQSVGDNFGTGADAGGLSYMIGYGDGRSEEGKKRPSQHRRMWFDRDMVAGVTGVEGAVLHCTKVTIFAVKGYCYGVHFMMAMAADLVIAADDTLFTHPAWRYLGPIFNHYTMVETVGKRIAAELYFTGGPFNAKRAYEVGIVNSVVPKDKLEEEVNQYAAACCSRPLDAIVMSKALMEMVGESRGMSTGAISEWIGHPWLTNQRLEPWEYNYVKTRRDKGVTNAFTDADMTLPPRFRISRKRMQPKE